MKNSEKQILFIGILLTGSIAFITGTIIPVIVLLLVLAGAGMVTETMRNKKLASQPAAPQPAEFKDPYLAEMHEVSAAGSRENWLISKAMRIVRKKKHTPETLATRLNIDVYPCSPEQMLWDKLDWEKRTNPIQNITGSHLWNPVATCNKLKFSRYVAEQKRLLTRGF